MDYSKMSDKEFVYYVRECYNAKDLALFKRLSEDSCFCERAKLMREKHIAHAFDYKLCNIVPNMYESYTNLYTLLKIVKDFNYIESDEERKKIMSNFFKPGFYDAMMLFSEEDKDIIRFFKDESWKYRYEKCEVNYDSIKDLLSIFEKYDSIEYCFAYLYDKSLINRNDNNFSYHFFNDIKRVYLLSMIYAESNLYREVKFSDIRYIINMKDECEKFFDKLNRFEKSSNFSFELSKEEYDNLEKFIVFAEEFLEKNNYNYYEFVNYIVTELKIDLDEFKKEYLNKFASAALIKNDNSNINMIRFVTIKNIYDCYRDLTTTIKKITEVICGNSKDRDRIIDMSYNIKFFNHINPNDIIYLFSGRDHLIETEEDRNKIQEYIEGYIKIYDQLMVKRVREEEEQRLINKEELENQQKNNIEEYAKIVKGFLDSNEKSIDKYLSKCYLPRNQFEEAVEIVKKFGHPIYETYFNYIENIRKTNFIILFNSAMKIIKLIKEGIKVSETETKPFDILDYYENTKIATDQFLKIIKGRVSSEDYAIASRFLAKHKNDCMLDANQIHALFAQKIAFATELDADHNPISEYEVTKEDKEQTIIILKERGIPITRKTYALMLRTYVFSEVLKIDSKKKVLKKS